MVCLLPCRSKQVQIIAGELGDLKDTINVFYRITKSIFFSAHKTKVKVNLKDTINVFYRISKQK